MLTANKNALKKMQKMPGAMAPPMPAQPGMPQPEQGADIRSLLGQPYEAPKKNFADRLGLLGGALMDYDGTFGQGNFDRAQERWQGHADSHRQAFDQSRNEQLMMAAASGDPHALFMLSPELGIKQRWRDEDKMAPPAPVKGTNLNGRLVNPYTGELIADHGAADALPSGMRMGPNGPEWIPGYIEGQEQMRARGAPQVNVNLPGGGENPYAGLPDGTIIEGPPGTANLTGGQYWAVRNGRPVIESAEGGAAAGDAADLERKEAGRRASIARASQTVMREAGRGLELMEHIVGWGDQGKESGVEIGGNEVLGANARIALSKIAGTAEWQWVKNLESARSNIGLDRLQEMRDNSPTGGALGQVPFQQQQRLEQVLGAFEIGMPQKAMEENLHYLQNAYMDITFGSAEERADLVRRGLLSEAENAEIQSHYHDLDWNKFGRRNERLKFNPATGDFE